MIINYLAVRRNVFQTCPEFSQMSDFTNSGVGPLISQIIDVLLTHLIISEYWMDEWSHVIM